MLIYVILKPEYCTIRLKQEIPDIGKRLVFGAAVD